MILINIVGTLPEWFAALVSLAGFSLIAATLRSQIEVQKQQQIITEIEIRRHKQEIKPQISIELIPGSFSVDNATKMTTVKYKLSNTSDNIAYDFHVGLSEHDKGSVIESDFGLKNLKFGKVVILTVKSTPTISHVKHYPEYWVQFNINIKYKDILGNEFNYYIPYYMGPELKEGVLRVIEDIEFL